MILLLLISQSLWAQYNWRKIGDLEFSRRLFGALPISSHQILVMGGYGELGITQTCEIIDIESSIITRTLPMNVARAESVFLLTRDSNIVAVSGLNSTNNDVTPVCEIFNRRTLQWSVIGRLLVGRRQHVACFLNNEEILVVGGRDETIATLRSAEIFNIRTGQSRMIADFPTPLNLGQAGLSSQNRPWVFAGRTGGANSSRTPTIYEYDIQLDRWIPVGNIMQGLQAASSLKLWNNRLILTGGSRAEEPLDYSANVYVEDNAQLRLLTQMFVRRSWHTTAQWNKDSVMILGGFDNNNITLTSSEWINVQTSRAGYAPPMLAAHSQFVALGMPIFNAQGQQTKARIVAISGLSNTVAVTPSVEILETDIRVPPPSPPSFPAFPAITAILGETNDCTVFRLTVRADFGLIKTVNLGTSANLSLEVVSRLPSQTVECLLRLQNPFLLPSLASLQITDTLDRTEVIRVQVNFPERRNSSLQVVNDVSRLFSDDVESLTCATLRVRNPYAREVVFPMLSATRNLEFSLPLSQFPFRIPANSEASLIVCYAPSAQVVQRDTLTFIHECGVLQVPLTARGSERMLSANSRCDVPIRVRTVLPSGITKGYTTAAPIIHAPFPQPVRQEDYMRVNVDMFAINISVPPPSITLYTSSGEHVANVNVAEWSVDAELSEIQHFKGTIVLDMRIVPNGHYRLKVTNHEGLYTTTSIIVAR